MISVPSNLFAALLMAVTLVRAGDPAPASGVQIVGKGFQAQAERSSFAEMANFYGNLMVMPGKFPAHADLTVRSLCAQLNQLLHQAGKPVQIVLETDLDPAKTAATYLDRPIVLVYTKKLDAAQLHQALPDMSADELLDIVEENTGLHPLYRKNLIILCNYLIE